MKSILASRVGNLKPSATLAISAKAKELQSQGVDVVGFGAGEPDFPTPEHIREAAKRSLDRGETFYTPVGGILSLKKAVIHRFKEDYGLEYKPEEILISCGAKHSLYNIIQALIGDGDEVLVLAPYWLSYPEMVELAGGVPVVAFGKEEDNFVPDLNDIEAKITSRTKAIIVNSPSNPTGVLYPESFQRGLADLAHRHDLVVISDEIYDKLLYDNLKFVPFATLPGMKERTVTVNGVSKTYAMTGFRIGYLASPLINLVKAATDIQSQSTSNPSSTAQAAAEQALKGPQDDVAVMASVFEKRRDLMINELGKIQGLRTVRPDGAFYAFVNVAQFLGRHGVNDSNDMARYLLETKHVACVPGGPFGSENHIRLSFAIDDQTIIKGIDRISGALKELA
ncbi:MAG: pyridoxal phosphate-dependent aminotransferase [Pseudomonadota bacterium]